MERLENLRISMFDDESEFSLPTKETCLTLLFELEDILGTYFNRAESTILEDLKFGKKLTCKYRNLSKKKVEVFSFNECQDSTEVSREKKLFLVDAIFSCQHRNPVLADFFD